MKNFFKSLILFLLFAFVFTEIAARIFHLSIDAPKTYKNNNGNVNYYPNQEGYWDGGAHKWFINSLGYPGKIMPESFDNLVLLIGDSYIQNFMNPDFCRQREYLSQLKPEYNFLEVSMAGINLLGYFEYAKPLDSLNPVLKIIYVSGKDFLSNIQKRNRVNGSYQVDLERGNINYPKYRGSKLKDFIYNFKFIYYLYRKNIDLFTPKLKYDENLSPDKGKEEDRIDQKEFKDISRLLDFIKTTYQWNNVVFVFHPNSDEKIINLTREKGFKAMEITNSENENWRTENHGHWNCYGHEQVAKQIAARLNKMD